MKQASVVFSLLALSLAALPPTGCRVWHDGCNTCTMEQPGSAMTCTLMFCATPTKEFCVEYFEEVSVAPPSCKVWDDGCNTCTRSEFGSPLMCTRMFCAQNRKPSCVEHFAATPPSNCKVWNDGCNTCTRSETGSSLGCTRMVCAESKAPFCAQYFTSVAPHDCKIWFDGCNTCTRMESGRPLACTEMACLVSETAECKEFFTVETPSTKAACPTLPASFVPATCDESRRKGYAIVGDRCTQMDKCAQNTKKAEDAGGFVFANLQQCRRKVRSKACSSPSIVSPSTEGIVSSLSCPAFEKVNNCGNLCEPECGNLVKVCPAICNPPACTCVEGFARNAAGTCVEAKACSSRPTQPFQPTLSCTSTEQVDECGNLCEAECGNPTKACPLICGPPACACKPGYARHANGNCVPDSACSSVRVENLSCPKFEAINSCGNVCEPECGNLNKVCPRICNPPACTCIDGYARNAAGTCVPRTSCPSQNGQNSAPCSNFETLNQCGNLCEAECGKPNKICPFICGPPACVCKMGYSRHASGQCVLDSACSTTAPTTSCSSLETLNQCGNACEAECGKANKICPMICGPPACVCKPGYSRQLDGQCVAVVACGSTPSGGGTGARCTLSTTARTDCAVGLICWPGPVSQQDQIFGTCRSNVGPLPIG